jgi:hypothetical protein
MTDSGPRGVLPTLARTAPSEAWVSLGGAVTYRPACVLYAGVTYALARGTGGDLVICDVAARTWSSLGGTLMSSPSTALAASGEIAVVAIMSSGELEVLFTHPGQDDSGWLSIGNGAPAGVTLASNPVLIAGSTSLLVAFCLDSNGNMWTIGQTSPQPDAWTSWTSLGAPASGALSTGATAFAAISQPTGAIEVIALGADGTMYSAARTSASAPWAAFAPLVTTGSNAPQSFNGPAATYCSALSGIVCGALNASSQGSGNPVVVVTSLTSAWSGLAVGTSQSPLLTSVPLMTNCNGFAQLFWLAGNGTGQLFMAAQASGAEWMTTSIVGEANPKFSGDLCGISNGSAITLFQLAGTTLEQLTIAAPSQTSRRYVPLRL